MNNNDTKELGTQPRHSTFLVWVEYTKAIALLLVILVHFTEASVCCPYFANPSAEWPSLEARIVQLQPLQQDGIIGVVVNIWRYIGWSGDVGVQLFLIISGFGLVWGILNRQGTESFGFKWFFRRRLSRIYPLWWAAHILLLGVSIIASTSNLVIDWRYPLSFIGIRITPDLFYYLSPSWWYIGLLIQLYLVFPFLWKALQRWGAWKTFLIIGSIAFLIRGIGLYVAQQSFPEYLDIWSRGNIFITRLPEFLFGMSFAWWMYHDNEQVEKFAKNRLIFVVAILIYIVGMVLSLLLWGMTFALFLLGLGLFIPIFVIFRNAQRSEKFDVGIWVGKHSYSLYLVHHTFIWLFISRGLNNVPSSFARFGLVIVATVISALFLEAIVNYTPKLVSKGISQYGVRGVVFRIVGAVVLVLVLYLSAEIFVRQFNPQEELGYGERASLEPDPDFGWRLIPSKTTHLRWLSYDYTVTSNSLGYPGPEYPEVKPPDTFRIMVTGDAYSSAEGVDTPDAWPRLLENELNDQLENMQVEVLNFSITGYGPNQYAAVVDAFAPVYKPDLLIVEMFVNDYDDVMLTDDEFRESIGFGLPAQDSIQSYFMSSHLRSFIRKEVIPDLLHKDRPRGYFFGYFRALETNQDDYDVKEERVRSRLAEIQAVAEQIDSDLMVILVPASSQVCSADDLPYYPSDVDLTDTEEFDINLPQKTTQNILDSLGVPLYDLREPLQATPVCPYQPYNLHWIEIGHQAVADYMTQVILEQEKTLE